MSDYTRRELKLDGEFQKESAFKLIGTGVICAFAGGVAAALSWDGSRSLIGLDPDVDRDLARTHAIVAASSVALGVLFAGIGVGVYSLGESNLEAARTAPPIVTLTTKTATAAATLARE